MMDQYDNQYVHQYDDQYDDQYADQYDHQLPIRLASITTVFFAFRSPPKSPARWRAEALSRPVTKPP